jgi:fucose permease
MPDAGSAARAPWIRAATPPRTQDSPSIAGIDDRSPSPYVRDAGTWLAYGLVLQFGFLQAALGPIVPYLRRELDLGYTVASLHVAALALGSVAGAIASRRVELRAGRRVLVALGAAGMACGGVGLALAPTVAGTIAASLLMGLCGTLSLVGAQSALADRHGERRAVALGEANVAGSLGAFSVPLLVAAGQAAGLTWRLAVAVGALLGALLVWRVRATGVHGPSASAGASRAAGTLPGPARVALVLVFCVVCVEWSVGFWSASFVNEEVGLSTDVAVTVSSLFFAAMLAGRLAGSVLARRIAAERLVGAGLALALAGFPVLWIAESAPAAAAGLVLIGLGVSALFPLSAAITFAAAPGLTALASGRTVTAGAAAVLTAPFVLGQVADAGGLRLAFGVVPVFLVMGLAALALVTRRPAPVPAAT